MLLLLHRPPSLRGPGEPFVSLLPAGLTLSFPFPHQTLLPSSLGFSPVCRAITGWLSVTDHCCSTSFSFSQLACLVFRALVFSS